MSWGLAVQESLLQVTKFNKHMMKTYSINKMDMMRPRKEDGKNSIHSFGVDSELGWQIFKDLK